MTITKRQFNHLSEMGINVWQQRSASNTLKADETESTLQAAIISIDENSLTQQTLFTDILQCLDLSLGEVTFENNLINLGLFNWQFIETDTISFTHNTLSTPAINAFITNNSLKKELWVTIQKEVLTQ